MNIMQSLIITLSMYTAIPMPMVHWNEKNLKYCMAFLPVAGLLVGLAEWLLFLLCSRVGISSVLFGVLACGVCVGLTGGIHMDGVIDTWDALGSHGTKEKRMAILEDPHVGAFGVTGAILYFLILFGVMAEIYDHMAAAPAGAGWYGKAAVVFLGFVLSRALAGFQIMSIKLSKEKGLLWTFASASSRFCVKAVSLTVSGICLICISVVFGFSALIPAAGLLCFTLYFRRMAVKNFGGLSGDLCGWFIHTAELVYLICMLAVWIV